MPNFRYQVIDATGKKSEGIVEAASLGEATRKLKTDGKYISSLTLDRGSGIANMTIGSPMLKTKDLVLISRQLASLLSAGITVVRALDMLYQQLDSKKAKKCIGEVYESVQGGRSLSEAFKELGIATGVFATFLGSDPLNVGGTPEQKADPGAKPGIHLQRKGLRRGDRGRGNVRPGLRRCGRSSKRVHRGEHALRHRQRHHEHHVHQQRAAHQRAMLYGKVRHPPVHAGGPGSADAHAAFEGGRQHYRTGAPHRRIRRGRKGGVHHPGYCHGLCCRDHAQPAGARIQSHADEALVHGWRGLPDPALRSDRSPAGGDPGRY